MTVKLILQLFLDILPLFDKNSLNSKFLCKSKYYFRNLKDYLRLSQIQSGQSAFPHRSDWINGPKNDLPLNFIIDLNRPYVGLPENIFGFTEVSWFFELFQTGQNVACLELPTKYTLQHNNFILIK